jgi:hypothetical protein
VESTIKKAREEAKQADRQLEVVMAADLNRHHILWGGAKAWSSPERRNEGNQIVDFIQEQGLQSMLKAGTITWEHQTARMNSTPDTVFASYGLANAVVRCDIHAVDHGSDHKAIVLETSTQLDNYEERERKRLYYDADWEAIRVTFKQHLAARYTWTSLDTKHQLDQAAEELVALVNNTLKEMVPRAKPSPYAKRWWTKELSQLRHELTVLRNQVTTLRRRGQDTTHARLLVHQARKTYFDKMDHQKATH